MIQFYTEKEKIRPEIMDCEAQKIASTILNVSPTQMRRIFDQIKQLQKRLNAGESWEDIEPLVRLQKAQLVYTIRRGKKNAGKAKEPSWDNLQHFLEEGIDSIKTDADYQAFCMMMEAVYAYHYARTPERI